MRKLNTRNKKYMYGLVLLTIVALGLIIYFIISKFSQMNIKYDIPSNSITFTKEREKLIIKDKTYAKKDFFNNYHIVIDDKKVNLGSYPVIYNENKIILLGSYYEVTSAGEVNKLNGFNEVSLKGIDHIYKISDRKYLIIGQTISSANKEIVAKDFLFVELDKIGNAKLYNTDFSTKAFGELKLETDTFIFNVNSEEVSINNEIIDLAKINGSTNNYQKPEENGGAGGGGGDTNANGPAADDKEQEIVDNTKIIARKTTVVDYKAGLDDIEITYLIHDPFDEYTEVYLEYDGKKEVLKTDETKVKLENLIPSKKYVIDFYYSYKDGENIKTSKFDTISLTTKSVNGQITLAKIKQNEVQYKLIVDAISLDASSCEVVTYINNVYSTSQKVIFNNNAFNGKSEINAHSGDFVTLKLEKCTYKGNSININANYKFKI